MKFFLCRIRIFCFFVVEHFAVGRRLSRLLSEIIVAVDLLAVRAIVSLLELFFWDK